MKLVLMRHAQKGITPFEDPDLTETGFQQAEVLLNLVRKKNLPTPTQAWVSTKIRTAQTLKNLCESYKVAMQVTDNLDLRNANESLSEFKKRVSAFLNQFELRAPETTDETHFLCTHYDWIEVAMTLINADKDLNSFEFSHWSPAQFILFEIENSTWKVIKIGNAHATKIN